MQPYPLVTIFGGSGFLGRHVVKRFTAAGWRVRVLTRDCVAAEFLKVAGYPGQVVIDYADITQPETLQGKCAGSSAVVNLVGVLYSRGQQSFTRVHAEGARVIAQHAAAAGATALVHVSALGVGAADAQYAKSKQAGEDAARGEFPAATTLRPSLIIGPEHGFFQRFARMSLVAPALPLIGGGTTRFQPVLVTDVAEAVFHCATHGETAGKTYELGGPEIYTFRQLMELLRSTTRRGFALVNLPSCVASLMGAVAELLPLPPMITRDQVRLLKTDNVVSDSAEGFAALGITPRPITAELPHYLARYTRQ